MGVNSAHAYVTASAGMAATATTIFVASATASGTAAFVNGFAIVAQEGSRSNGILILVEADNRAIKVDAEIRTILVEPGYRVTFAEAA